MKYKLNLAISIKKSFKIRTPIIRQNYLTRINNQALTKMTTISLVEENRSTVFKPMKENKRISKKIKKRKQKEEELMTKTYVFISKDFEIPI